MRLDMHHSEWRADRPAPKQELGVACLISLRVRVCSCIRVSRSKQRLPAAAVGQMSETQPQADLRTLDDRIKRNPQAQARQKAALMSSQGNRKKQRTTMLDVCFIRFVWYAPSS